MTRKILTAALASAAIAIAAPAVAAPGGGGGGGGHGGGMGAPGGVGGGMGGMGGPSQTGIDARAGSMGAVNASPTGIDHSSPNSALHNSTSTTTTTTTTQPDVRGLPGTSTTTKATTGALAGLTTGTTLYSNGSSVGTVQQIRTTGNGSVAVVVVKGTNGGFYAVPANKLSLANGTLSTTARLAGVNGSTSAMAQGRANSQGPYHASPTGIAHANSHSVLAGGAVASTTLPGLTTGLTVQNSAGTSLGTVSRVVTDSSGNIRMVYVTSPGGQTYAVAPSSLSISGNVVTTSSTTLTASRR